MIRRCILRAVITVLFLCPSFVFAATGDSLCKIPDLFLNERPDPEGVPTRVKVGLYLVDITEINSKKQIFTADLTLFLSWKDSRLAGDSSGISFASCKLKPAQVWTPGVLFRNEIDIKRTFSSFKVDQTGTVTFTQRFYGDFSVPLDLKKFPFDTQILQIVVGNIDYGAGELIFEVNEARIGMGESLTPDWKIHSPTARVEIGKYRFDGLKRSMFLYEAKAHRDPNFYIWKVFFPMMLIVFMSWAVFWINPEPLAPRISLSLISMLNIIAYNFAISTFIPRISYLSLADYYILGCLVIVFFTLVVGISSSILSARGNKVQAKRIDKISRWAAPAIFLLLTGFSAMA
jgi:hypothetical protein